MKRIDILIRQDGTSVLACQRCGGLGPTEAEITHLLTCPVLQPNLAGDLQREVMRQLTAKIDELFLRGKP